MSGHPREAYCEVVVAGSGGGVQGGHSGLGHGGVFGAKVTGIADGTDLETTARYPSDGQVTRQVRIEDKRGRVHESEGTLDGQKVLLLIAAATTIPPAVKVAKIQAHEALWTRAWVTQDRAKRGK